ncbi:hypothetical protein BCU17_17200 [Vibrio splendidus]|uniref:Trimeric autotransporter adhesin YadA-like C-terminal membrane anchor domain-containing protein n=1 Tax=Vibrio splendidus TaxID=29497 RepID=A0A2N7FDY2_VIBSP|nr:YadA C-terminal domain-containing protein [Vibrio splendidus]PMJ67505.1 hypothetical protein BCU17_17200 [Vibrio splendidus]
MKKTIIALSLASVFAAPVMAQNVDMINVNKNDVKQSLETFDNNYRVDSHGNVFHKAGNNIQPIGAVTNNEDGTISFKDDTTGESYSITNPDGGNISEVTYDDGNGNSISGKVVDNDMKPTPLPPHPDSNVDVTPVTEIKTSDIQKAINDGYELDVDAKGNAKIVKNGKTQAVATKNGDGTYTVVDGNTGERSIVNPKDIAITDDTTANNERNNDQNNHDKAREEARKKDEEARKQWEKEQGTDIVKPIAGDDEKAIEEAEKAISGEVDKRIGAAGAAAYNEASAYATATDAKLANHESRIGSLEKDMQAMGNKMLVLEDRMDGVVASSHAITNARPVLNSAGQFGMGVGMGAAGSKQAIAIGGAYQISDNWSGTMSVNYETKGKVSNDQLSAGVGAQYIF